MTSAVDYVLEHVDGGKILQHYEFLNVTDQGNSYRACCKLHNSNNPTSFMWNKSNNLWYCFSGDCGGGDIFTMVQKLEHVDFQHSVHIAANILGLSIDGMEVTKRPDHLKTDTIKWMTAMKHMTQEDPIFEYQMPITTYYSEEYRTFSKETLNNFGIKTVKLFPTNDIMLYNKLVVPIYFNSKLVGITARSLDDTQPKWLHQPKGLKTSNLLYNYDNAMKTESSEIILVEGVFDVLAYYDIGVFNVVGLFGSNLSKKQEELLLQSGRTLVLSLDNDSSGNKCKEHIKSSLKYKADFKEVELPEGLDPCDVGPAKLLKAYMSRK